MIAPCAMTMQQLARPAHQRTSPAKQPPVTCHVLRPAFHRARANRSTPHIASTHCHRRVHRTGHAASPVAMFTCIASHSSLPAREGGAPLGWDPGEAGRWQMGDLDSA
eukprot:scaffold15406_cov119-Isochrysis_galbana.AAC.1